MDLQSSGLYLALKSAVKLLRVRANCNKLRDQRSEFTECKQDPQTILDNAFICDHCNEPFTAKSLLELHMTSVHNSAISNIVIVESMSLKCTVCDFEGISKKHLEKHSLSHATKRRFACDMCRRSFVTRDILQTHNIEAHTRKKILKAHPDKKFIISDHKSSTKSILTPYLRKHIGEKHFQCDLCNYKSCIRYHYKRHLKIHTGEKPFHCDLCDYKATLRDALICHLKTHSGMQKQFYCDVCGFKCSRSSNLKRHITIHTDEQPFHCDLCNYKTRQKNTLIRHLRIHTGEKPFHCHLCDYKTIQKKSLTKHVLRMHTGKKPFQCNLCGYRSRKVEYLKRHARIHTGK